ncbi:MAG: hydrogenase maturation protease [Thiotrichales bacterium]
MGSPFGADTLGWRVIVALRAWPEFQARHAEYVATEICDRPGSDILRVLHPYERAIVVDAMCSGAAGGTVRELTLDDLPRVLAPASSHGFGLAAALQLGRVLRQLPERLVIVGIEWTDSIDAYDPSAAVSRILDLLETIPLADSWHAADDLEIDSCVETQSSR